MPRRKIVDHWTVGDYRFAEYDDNGQALFSFAIGDQPEGYELYGSLDHAMAAAIAERHTGRRGAAGEAVGTAADWFMRMIGAAKTE